MTEFGKKFMEALDKAIPNYEYLGRTFQPKDLQYFLESMDEKLKRLMTRTEMKKEIPKEVIQSLNKSIKTIENYFMKE